MCSPPWMQGGLARLLELLVISNKVNYVDMLNAVARLEYFIGSCNIPRVVIASYRFEASEFSFFRLSTRQDCICHLDVGVIHIAATHDKIAFKLSDSPDAYHIVIALCVIEHYIFEHRSEIYPIIRIQCIIEREVRQVKLFLASQGFSRFHVKSIARSNNFCIFERLNVTVYGISPDFRSIFIQIIGNVSNARCRAEIVDDVFHDSLEGSTVSDDKTLSYVFFINLVNQTLHIGAFVNRGIKLHCI